MAQQQKSFSGSSKDASTKAGFTFGSDKNHVFDFKDSSMENKAIVATIENAANKEAAKATSDKAKIACHLLKLPAELRLPIYKYALDDVKMDGDGTALDRAVTCPGLLETCKFIRGEAMETYIDKVFGTIIDMREEHITIKEMMQETVESARRARRNDELCGHLSLGALELTHQQGSYVCQLERYVKWLDRKAKKLKEEGHEIKPAGDLVVKFKKLVLDSDDIFPE